MHDICLLSGYGAEAINPYLGYATISNIIKESGIKLPEKEAYEKYTKSICKGILKVMSKMGISTIQSYCGAQIFDAVGLSGNSGILYSEKLNEKLGFVGKIVSCNTDLLNNLLDNGYLPVISPMALSVDSKNQIYNTNADTAAGVIARELGADNVIFQTDVPGVFDTNKRVIPQMTKKQALDLIDSGIVQGGMIPKIKSCIEALSTVNVGRIIDGRNSGALLTAFTNGDIGTRIV